MKQQEWHFTDKSTWGDGEWMSEPDKMQWTDEATGLPCLIVRGPSGALCGYVGVSSSHPAFEKDFSDVDVSCHGGLTFADKCSGTEHGICHKVEDGEDDNVWWLGFDCYHGCDIGPGAEARYRAKGIRSLHDSDAKYRTVDYVKREVTRLAEQLKAIATQPHAASAKAEAQL
jgi:hypothetical protein